MDLAPGGEVRRWQTDLRERRLLLDARRRAGRRPALRRRPMTSAAARPVAVLSYAFWQREYGGDRRDRPARSLMLDGHRVDVVGVAAPAFTASKSAARSTSPSRSARSRSSAPPGAAPSAGADTWWLAAIGRLKPGVYDRAGRRAAQRDLAGHLRVHRPAALRSGRRQGVSAVQAVCLAGRDGRVDPPRRLQRSVEHPARRHRIGAADRLRQSRQPDARPRHGARARNRRAAGDRRVARRDRPADAVREPADCRRSAPPAASCSRGWFSRFLVAFLEAAGRRCSWTSAPGWRVFAFTTAVAGPRACCSASSRRSAPRARRLAVGDEGGQPRHVRLARAFRPSPRAGGRCRSRCRWCSWSWRCSSCAPCGTSRPWIPASARMAWSSRASTTARAA